MSRRRATPDDLTVAELRDLSPAQLIARYQTAYTVVLRWRREAGLPDPVHPSASPEVLDCLRREGERLGVRHLARVLQRDKGEVSRVLSGRATIGPERASAWLEAARAAEVDPDSANNPNFGPRPGQPRAGHNRRKYNA